MWRWWLIDAALALMLGASGPPAIAADDASPPKQKQAAAKKAEAEKEPAEPFKLAGPLVFKLEESPAIGKVEIDGRPVQRYLRGPYAQCSGERSKTVKAYPKLKSKQPLYGELRFDGDLYDPTLGKAVYFVLDESGEQPKPSEEKKEADDKKQVLLIQSDAAKYDRLYVDLNGDGDLTNDAVLKLTEKSPAGAPAPIGQRLFEAFSLPVDYGAPTGTKPFEMVAWVGFARGGMGIVYFATPTCRRGKIKIGEQEFEADLAQTGRLSGRYDRPFVQLQLTPLGEATKTGQMLQTSLGGYLGQIRQIDGQWIGASASPTGDQLTIAPYRGEFGVLEVGPGGRTITGLGLSGRFASRTALVTFGDSLSQGAELPRRFELPVGEYLPVSLVVQYGRVRVNCSVIADNPSKPPVRSIQIRKGKPYVLSLSGKPAVDFSSPPKNASFKPGQSVMLRALLNEPENRIKIVGLYDTTKKEGETKGIRDGQIISMARYARLDPTIAIRNSSGEIVAEGKMPFG